jgi:hypothetical protein
MGPVARGTTENESGRVKYENETRRHRYRRKRVRARMKTGPERPCYRGKRLRAQNMKTGPDTLVSAENESGRAKHENGTRCTRHRKKHVREHKT